MINKWSYEFFFWLFVLFCLVGIEKRFPVINKWSCDFLG